MNKIISVCYISDGPHLYEDDSCSGVTSAYIKVDDGRFEVDIELEDKNPSVTIEISASDMDRLAIAWCKHRKIHGALGGPVGKEFGSPDAKYDWNVCQSTKPTYGMLKDLIANEDVSDEESRDSAIDEENE